MENKSLELLKALAEIRLENSKRVKQNKDDDCKINLPVGKYVSIDDAIAAINKLDKIREKITSLYELSCISPGNLPHRKLYDMHNKIISIIDILEE